MAGAFNLTARLNLQGPFNARPVVDQINRQLGNIRTRVRVDIDSGASKRVDALNKNLVTLQQNLRIVVQLSGQAASNLSNLANSFNRAGAAAGNNARQQSQQNAVIASTARGAAEAASEMEEFGRVSGLAIRRFAGFTIATGLIFGFIGAVKDAVSESIKFERELIRVAQVAKTSIGGLADLNDEITRLSTGLGVGSVSLLGASRTLSQAGLSINETRRALEALAKTELAPTFQDIETTTEGAIAAIRQFKLDVRDLDGALGSINAVAAQFAVESGDIIGAIRRAGGVFSAASGDIDDGITQLQQFIAVFTSVRATTRENAESIATGLRTIFTRLQRRDTIQNLEELGIQLTDVEGKFIGPFRAIENLNKALGNLDPRDLRFSQIAEELGGFRQISKTIPLIKEFASAQKALNVAQEGQNSLSADAEKAQEALAVKLLKTKEEFLALVREISQTDTFKALADTTLIFANSLIDLARGLKPVIPLLTAFAAFRGAQAFTGFVRGFRRGVGSSGSTNIGQNLGQNLAGNQSTSATQANTNAVNNNTRTTQSKSQQTAAIINATTLNTNALNTLTSAVNNLSARVGNTAISGRRRLAKGGNVRRLNAGGQVIQPRGVNIKAGTSGVTGKGRSGTAGSRIPSFGAIFLSPTGVVRDQTGSFKKSVIGDARKNQLGSSFQKKFSGTDVPFNLTSVSIPEKLAEQLQSDIEKDVLNSVNSSASSLLKGLGAGFDSQGFKNSLKTINIDSIIGNIYEGALLAAGAPYGDRKSNEAFDFPKGLGKLAGLFNAPFLRRRPVEAKKTYDENSVKSIYGKIQSYLGSVNATSQLQDKVFGGKNAAFLTKVAEGRENPTKEKLKPFGFDGGNTPEEKRAFAQGLRNRFGFQAGGTLQGVETLLTPKELVFSPETVSQIGLANLQKFNETGDVSFLRDFDPAGVSVVPGTGSTDNYRANLPEGSFVVKQSSADALPGNFPQTKRFNRGGSVGPRRYAGGGVVAQSTVYIKNLTTALINATKAYVNPKPVKIDPSSLRPITQAQAQNLPKALPFSSAKNPSLGDRLRDNPAAAFAALSIGPLLQQIIGNNSGASSALGAGITGATTGALTGSAFGPLGIGIGALVGAVSAATSAFVETEDRLSRQKLSDSIESFKDALDKVGKGELTLEEASVRAVKAIDSIKDRFDFFSSGAGGSTATADVNVSNLLLAIPGLIASALDGKRSFGESQGTIRTIGSEIGIAGLLAGIARGDASGILKNSFTSRGQTIKEQTVPGIEELLATISNRVRAGEDIGDVFRSSGGSTRVASALAIRNADPETLGRLSILDPLEREAELLGMALDQGLLQEFKKTILASAELQKQLDSINSTISLLGFRLSGFADAAREAQGAGQIYATLLDDINAGFSSIPSSSLKNIGSLSLASDADFSQRLGLINNVGGPGVAELSQALTGVRQLEIAGPKAIAEAVKNAGLDADSTEANFADAISGIPGFKDIPSDIRNALFANIRDIVGSRQGGGEAALEKLITEDVEKAFGALETQFGEQAKSALNEFNKLIEGSAERFNKASNAYSKALLDATSKLDEAGLLRGNAANQLVQAKGGILSPAQLSAPINQLINNLTNRGGIRGGSNDPQAIARSLIDLRTQREDLIRQRDQRFNTNGADDPIFKNLTDRLRINSQREQDLGKALDTLATDITELSAIERELVNIQQRRENARGFGRDLLSATVDPEAAIQIQKSVGAAVNLLSGQGAIGKGDVDLATNLINEIASLVPEENAKALRDLFAEQIGERLKQQNAPQGLIDLAKGNIEKGSEATLEQQFQNIAERQAQAIEAQGTLFSDTAGRIEKIMHDELSAQTKAFQDLVEKVNDIRGNVGGNLAGGGIIRGKGGPKSDKIPFMLSNGESVLTAEATKKLGYDFINNANQGKINYAAGGFIGDIFDEEKKRRERLENQKKFEANIVKGGFAADAFANLNLQNSAPASAFPEVKVPTAKELELGRERIRQSTPNNRLPPELSKEQKDANAAKAKELRIRRLLNDRKAEELRRRLNSNPSANKNNPFGGPINQAPNALTPEEEAIFGNDIQVNIPIKPITPPSQGNPFGSIGGLNDTDPYKRAEERRKKREARDKMRLGLAGRNPQANINKTLKGLSGSSTAKSYGFGNNKSPIFDLGQDYSGAATQTAPTNTIDFTIPDPTANSTSRVNSKPGGGFSLSGGSSTKTTTSGPGNLSDGSLREFSKAASQLAVAINNLGDLAQVANNLNAAVKQLSEIHIPEKIQIESAPIRVEVVINGAEAFANMQGPIGELVQGKIRDALGKAINPITGETSERFV